MSLWTMLLRKEWVSCLKKVEENFFQKKKKGKKFKILKNQRNFSIHRLLTLLFMDEFEADYRLCENSENILVFEGVFFILEIAKQIAGTEL